MLTVLIGANGAGKTEFLKHLPYSKCEYTEESLLECVAERLALERIVIVDNFGALLNPVAYRQFIPHLADIMSDRECWLVTHNPAVLDGLNLDAPNQRLWVVYRNKSGEIKTREVIKPPEAKTRVSEAFIRGYIGGLNKD